MSSTEKMTMRRPGISGTVSGPMENPASSQRSHSFAAVITKAATTVPVMEPIPPKTTMSKMS